MKGKLIDNRSKVKVLWTECILMDESASFSKTTEIEILNGLAELNRDVRLLALRSKEANVKSPSIHLSIVPLRAVSLLTPVIFTAIEAITIPLYIARSKADVIITEPGGNFLGLITSLIVKKIKKVKFILDIRSPPVVAYGISGFVEKKCFLLSVSFAKKFFDGITIITPRMRNEICQQYSINADRVGVWPSGVSIEKFRPEKFNQKSLKKRLGFSGKFIVFYHGYFAKDRGLKETVDAMEILKSTYPNIVFFLLGGGLFADDLKSMVAERELTNVIVHDPVRYMDVPKFIAMSDVGIVPLPDLPHWRSQSPLKLLEYLSMKKPVILTDIPAHKDVVRDEKFGIYLRSIDPQEIADRIIQAYQNREALSKWGVKGREFVKENYSWKKVAKKLDNYITAVRLGAASK